MCDRKAVNSGGPAFAPFNPAQRRAWANKIEVKVRVLRAALKPFGVIQYSRI
ncbi:MAG: hypothetical protein ACKO13_16455 [Cytophagales bacterium]